MKVSVYVKNCYILRLFSLQQNEFYLILQLTSGTMQHLVSAELKTPGKQQSVMCETSSAEKYSGCIETIQKAPQCAIQRVVINLYQITYVTVKHFGCFPATLL